MGRQDHDVREGMGQIHQVRDALPKDSRLGAFNQLNNSRVSVKGDLIGEETNSFV